MSTDLARVLPTQIENVMINGDLSKLSPQERVIYYMAMCESLGLNPLTKPFDYIPLSGKLTLYATRNCGEQLRKIYGVSITDMTTQLIGDDMLVVTVKGVDSSGRCDIASGAVSLKGLTGEAKANAMLKCETKAKRRLALSICSLGMLDETEVESIQTTARKIEYAPPAAEVVTPIMERTKFGSIIRAAIKQQIASGTAITAQEITEDAFVMMRRYYDTLDSVVDATWAKKGEAMAAIYVSVADDEAEMIATSIMGLQGSPVEEAEFAGAV